MERQTKQRDAIRSALAEADRPLSISEILDSAKGRVSGLGVATVYRTLKALVQDGQIVQVEMPGSPPRYELAGKEHHHHFYCRSCERVYEVEGCAGDFSWMTPAGFELEAHDVLLSGRCARCVEKKKSGGPPAGGNGSASSRGGRRKKAARSSRS